MKGLWQALFFVTLMSVTAARSIPVQAGLPHVQGKLPWEGSERSHEPSTAVAVVAREGSDSGRYEQRLVKIADNDQDDTNGHHGHRLHARAKSKNHSKYYKSKEKPPGAPRYPTRKEMEAVLDADTNQQLVEARAGLRIYNAALEKQKEAKAIGRKLTPFEEANLLYGRRCAADYSLIRHQALKLIAMGDKPPVEVFAKYQEYLEEHREESKEWLANLTPKQRERYNQRKLNYIRMQREQRDRRIEELEVLAENQNIDKAGQQELDNLKAQKEQEVLDSKTRYAENKPAAQAKAATTRAEKATLERRVRDKIASPKEQQQWADIETEKKRVSERRSKRRKVLIELERIITDPEGKPTKAQRKEWEKHVARGNAQRVARKARQDASLADLAQNQGGDDVDNPPASTTGDQSSGSGSSGPKQSSININNPSTGGPLQFSGSLRRSPGVHQPSWLANPMGNFQQVRQQTSQITSMLPNQLKGALQDRLQSISMAARNPNWPRQLIPVPQSRVPAGVRIPVH